MKLDESPILSNGIARFVCTRGVLTSKQNLFFYYFNKSIALARLNEVLILLATTNMLVSSAKSEILPWFVARDILFM